ncbi:MAG: hypothetical protein RIK87_25210 [Fuerstiella sp.]
MESTFPFGFSGSLSFYLSLYVLTLVLHAFFMTYVLAGSLYLAWTTIFPGATDHPRGQQPLALILKDWMPFVLSAAITAGVAPLLFVQVLYRQQFYTANLLLGLRWLLVVPVLIIAFYLLYVWKSQFVARWSVASRVILAAGVAGCFVFVAFCWTANHLLALNQQSWASAYGGGSVVSSVSSLLARLATWIAGAFPTMSILAGWQLWHFRSRSGNQEAAEQEAAAKGTRHLCLVSLAGLAFAVGSAVVYAAMLDKPLQDAVLGSAGRVWLVATAAGVVLQAVCWVMVLKRKQLTTLSLAMISVAGVIALIGTASLREVMRLAQSSLETVTENARLAEAVGGLGLFLGSSVIAGLLITGCVLVTRWGRKPGSEAA